LCCASCAKDLQQHTKQLLGCFDLHHPVPSKQNLEELEATTFKMCVICAEAYKDYPCSFGSTSAAEMTKGHGVTRRLIMTYD
jgi:hypothetical protein